MNFEELIEENKEIKKKYIINDTLHKNNRINRINGLIKKIKNRNIMKV